MAKRKWNEKAGGYQVFKKGTEEEINCPECKDDVIVYNGNYFCAKWNSGNCKWALAHPARSKRDKEICDLLGTDYY